MRRGRWIQGCCWLMACLLLAGCAQSPEKAGGFVASAEEQIPLYTEKECEQLGILDQYSYQMIDCGSTVEELARNSDIVVRAHITQKEIFSFFSGGPQGTLVTLACEEVYKGNPPSVFTVETSGVPVRLSQVNEITRSQEEFYSLQYLPLTYAPFGESLILFGVETDKSQSACGSDYGVYGMMMGVYRVDDQGRIDTAVFDTAKASVTDRYPVIADMLDNVQTLQTLEQISR